MESPCPVPGTVTPQGLLQNEKRTDHLDREGVRIPCVGQQCDSRLGVDARQGSEACAHLGWRARPSAAWRGGPQVSAQPEFLFLPACPRSVFLP